MHYSYYVLITIVIILLMLPPIGALLWLGRKLEFTWTQQSVLSGITAVAIIMVLGLILRTACGQTLHMLDKEETRIIMLRRANLELKRAKARVKMLEGPDGTNYD